MSRLEEFRREKDDFFRAHPQSPLTDEQRASFAGLVYFTENPHLLIQAELEAPVDPTTVEMQTSTGGAQTYTRAGIVRFDVDGERSQVTLFASEDMDELFLPFRDATSGKETYGAGRYLEVDQPREGRVTIDFNLAYNPYCAYNPNWSCPIPPGENWLAVPIRAGEKDFAARAP